MKPDPTSVMPMSAFPQTRAFWTYTHPTDPSLKVSLAWIRRGGPNMQTGSLVRYRNSRQLPLQDGDRLNTPNHDAMEHWLKQCHDELLLEGLELTEMRGFAKAMHLGPAHLRSQTKRPAPSAQPVVQPPRLRSAMVPIVF